MLPQTVYDVQHFSRRRRGCAAHSSLLFVIWQSKGRLDDFPTIPKSEVAAPQAPCLLFTRVFFQRHTHTPSLRTRPKCLSTLRTQLFFRHTTQGKKNALLELNLCESNTSTGLFNSARRLSLSADSGATSFFAPPPPLNASAVDQADARCCAVQYPVSCGFEVD